MKPRSPCLFCKDRTITCHSTCKAYLDFSVEIRAYNRKLVLERQKDWLNAYNRKRIK